MVELFFVWYQILGLMRFGQTTSSNPQQNVKFNGKDIQINQQIHNLKDWKNFHKPQKLMPTKKIISICQTIS